MLIQFKEKLKERKLDEGHGLVEAGIKIHKTIAIYQQNCSKEAQQKLPNKSHKLHQAYKEIQKEQLEDTIKHAEDADARSKHDENWKTNKKITGCKIPEQVIILEKRQF